VGSARIIAGIAAGVGLGLGGVIAADGLTEKADAQGGFAVTPGQLRINQKISRAAVRRANQNRKDIQALQEAVQQGPPGSQGPPGPAGPAGETGPPGATSTDPLDLVEAYTRRRRADGADGLGLPADTPVDLVEIEVAAGSYVAVGSSYLEVGGAPGGSTFASCVIYTGLSANPFAEGDGVRGPYGIAGPQPAPVSLGIATQYAFTASDATTVKLACKNNRGWSAEGGELTVTRVDELTQLPAQG
jgi:hypothetical protein